MALLKKVKSATLVEALVATVLIVVIFTISSLVLNNLILNTFSKNTHQIEDRLNELEYEIQNNSMILPYNEEYQDWSISIQKEKANSIEMLSIKAVNAKTGQEVTKKTIHEQ